MRFSGLSMFLTTSLLCLMSSQLHANPPAVTIASQSFKKELLARVINAEKLLSLADTDENMVVFDARHLSAHKQGHIAWSVPFVYNDLNENFLEKHVTDKSTIVVFYGTTNSPAAANATSYAIKAGYKSAYWLRGGWQEWKKKKLSLK